MTVPKDPKKRADYLYMCSERAKDSKYSSYGRNAPNWKGGFLKTGKSSGEIREELIQRQGNVCAICGKPEMSTNQWGSVRLSIDHNHTTGEIRGLLCRRCNSGIGHFDDSVELIQQAKLYLEGKMNFKWWEVVYMKDYTNIRRYINLPYEIVLNNCKTIMEIGVCTGHNAVQMIEAAVQYNVVDPKNVIYYGFDLFEEELHKMVDEAIPQKGFLSRPLPFDEVLEKLRKTGATINLIQGTTFETLPEFVEKHLYDDIGLIFIDAGHSFKSVQNDWDCAQELMDWGTVVLFDDYFSGGHVEGGEQWGVSQVVDHIDLTRYSVEKLKPLDILLPPQDVTMYPYVPSDVNKSMNNCLVKVKRIV